MSALGGMTVGELREALADVPDFYEVHVEGNADCEECAGAPVCIEPAQLTLGTVRVVLSE